jgi:16S rRNA (guanine527-N7)-methyltransferase
MTGAIGHGLARARGLSARQVWQLEAILRTLERDEYAPTTVRDAPRALDIHIADSLAALDVQLLAGASRIADLGAGAGFPGAAIAVALPSAELALVESQRRKCDFLVRMCANAEIHNARVVCARAEEWSEGTGTIDVATARAVAPQQVVLEYAAPLLRVGGALIDWRGRRNGDEEESAVRAAVELGLELVEIRRVEPFAGATDRHLHVFEKVTHTPSRFPRRAGMARKRPLGA